MFQITHSGGYAEAFARQDPAAQRDMQILTTEVGAAVDIGYVVPELNTAKTSTSR